LRVGIVLPDVKCGGGVDDVGVVEEDSDALWCWVRFAGPDFEEMARK
jgi:hypothetical protein